jgi:RES domain-containing protein
MRIYRLARASFAEDLSGTGARLVGGRWNSPGRNALYAASHISLSVLELLVHIRTIKIPPDFQLVHLEIPESLSSGFTETPKLKRNWKDDLGYTRKIGDEFLKQKDFLLLRVPSAIVETEYNYVLNCQHADYKKIKIASVIPFEFDKRLYDPLS